MFEKLRRCLFYSWVLIFVILFSPFFVPGMLKHVHLTREYLLVFEMLLAGLFSLTIFTELRQRYLRGHLRGEKRK